MIQHLSKDRSVNPGYFVGHWNFSRFHLSMGQFFRYLKPWDRPFPILIKLCAIFAIYRAPNKTRINFGACLWNSTSWHWKVGIIEIEFCLKIGLCLIFWLLTTLRQSPDLKKSLSIVKICLKWWQSASLLPILWLTPFYKIKIKQSAPQNELFLFYFNSL